MSSGLMSGSELANNSTGSPGVNTSSVNRRTERPAKITKLCAKRRTTNRCIASPAGGRTSPSPRVHRPQPHAVTGPGHLRQFRSPTAEPLRSFAQRPRGGQPSVGPRPRVPGRRPKRRVADPPWLVVLQLGPRHVELDPEVQGQRGQVLGPNLLRFLEEGSSFGLVEFLFRLLQ